LVAIVSLLACAPEVESIDHVRFEELMSAHRIAPSADVSVEDALAVYDFVTTTSDGEYSQFAQLSISQQSEDEYTVLVLNGWGTSSGWRLRLVRDGRGFEITNAMSSPCFYF
jgi:hypothetical protein